MRELACVVLIVACSILGLDALEGFVSASGPICPSCGKPTVTRPDGIATCYNGCLLNPDGSVKNLKPKGK